MNLLLINNGFTYEPNDINSVPIKLTVVACSLQGDISIPATIVDTILNETYAVTIIGSHCFTPENNITSITIPEGIITISAYAFVGVDNNGALKSNKQSLTIPDSVETIGTCAFYNCHGITSLILETISSNLQTISDSAFDNALQDDQSLTIPDSVNSIGDSAFAHCNGITSIIFPNNITFTTISYNAFSDCSKIQSLTIPDSVETIDEYAFYGCYGITSLILETTLSKLKTISDYAFYNSSNIQSLTIPDSVETIGTYAFHGCSGITSIQFPNNTKFTTISDFAFYGSSNIQSLTIPNSVESIGVGAFGVSLSSSPLSLTIPYSVEIIGAGAFAGCSGITNLIFYNNSNISVDSSAFQNCSITNIVYNNQNQSGIYPNITGGNIMHNFGNGTYNTFTKTTSYDGKFASIIITTELPENTVFAVTYDQDSNSNSNPTFNTGTTKTIILSSVNVAEGGSSITIPALIKDQQYAFKISYGIDQSTYSGLNTLTTACFMEGTKILCKVNNNTGQY